MNILNNACTKTVTGKTWLDAFVDALSAQDKYLVEYFWTETKFKLRDGTEVTAARKVKFLALNGRKKVTIVSCKVNNKILLSKTSMKKTGII